ncbi:hypothetical protein [Gottfriedia acidiceleris]|uniref:hypothetical protein n=1 Tax=Gottfriedia acidiceleris TaxID=371036 RepID=UPI002FFF81F9
MQDHAIPVLKQSSDVIEMNGAYLYKQSKNTGVKLSKDQVIMMMLLLGEKFVRVNLTADLFEESKGKSLPNKVNKNDIGFSVKEIDSKYTVSKGSKGLPKVTIFVSLKINAYDLGTGILLAKDKYSSQKEKELSKNLEEIARSTIDSMQHVL